MSINLVPGQYMIGDVIFGRHTKYPVTSVEIQSYQTNALDYQNIRADETQFGQDNFVPQPVIFTLGVTDTYILPNMLGMTSYDPDLVSTIEAANRYNLHDLARAWRGDDVKGQWGVNKPLACCERDGRTLLWFGRPRKFQYTKRSRKSEFFTIQAEYMRSDTLQYSGDEYGVEISPGDTETITRVAGDMPSWYRILIYGPATHPIIEGLTEPITGAPIELDIEVPADEVLEISSYPWVRRIVDSLNFNRAAALQGNTQYLDQLRIAPYSSTEVTWDAEDTNGDSRMVFAWRDAYSVMA